MICEKCKYWKEFDCAYGLHMDGTADSDNKGSCMFLKNGIKIRGIKKSDDTCEDFENGKLAS